MGGRDAIRNERRLVEATGEVLRDTSPREVTMGMIAERAGLSPATAYRCYSSVDVVMNAYLVEVLTRLRNLTDDCPETGEMLFRTVLAEWGPAGRRVRASNGSDALAPGLPRTAARGRRTDHGRPVGMGPADPRSTPGDRGRGPRHRPGALYLNNIMFDPREILDLRAEHGDFAKALDELVIAFRTALGGWAAGRP